MKQVEFMQIESYRNGSRGDISVIENAPFNIKRVFFIYNVPPNIMRGGHAHKKCHQMLVAVCGVVLVKIEGGPEFLLDCPEYGLYVPPKHIIHLTFLIKDSVLMVLASEKYDKEDYIYG